jgi:hypothetical protein
VDFGDLREVLGGGGFQQAAAGVAVQLDERGQRQAGGGGADAGVIALDDPGLFQAADRLTRLAIWLNDSRASRWI